jgi:hypothetical protein
MEDLNKGEIYLIRNKVNGKGYVGKADKYVSYQNNKWGTDGRWKSHLREAFSESVKDHCVLLNQAIRKYGKHNFEVTKVCDCDSIELGAMEDRYIKEFGTKVPNGYNLRDGSNNGKAAPETIQKQIEYRTGRKHHKQWKQNISTGQLGNRRGTKQRKNPDDEHLPKYISASRKDGTIIAYTISGFPVGVTEKKYISKSFGVTCGDIDNALKRALAHLESLKEEYKHIADQLEKNREKAEELSAQEKLKLIWAKKLPANVFPVLQLNKIASFYVDGLVGHDGSVIPRRDFDAHKNNAYNLCNAKLYAAFVKEMISNKKPCADWSAIAVPRGWKPKEVEC